MDRSIKMIGFVGIDKYEYILYTARVLYQLGKKVLMIDYSEYGALTSCVPNPFKLSGTIIDYRGVRFVDCRDFENVLRICDSSKDLFEFEVLLVDFGFRTVVPELLECNHVVCVTDQQAHNIERIKEVKTAPEITITLVIKDMVLGKVNLKYISHEVKESICGIEHIYFGYHDEIDASCKISSQHNSRFRFHNLSRQSRSIVKGLVAAIYPETVNKALEVAYKKAGKGD